jgi:cysteinyl-tRNA synthetase
LAIRIFDTLARAKVELQPRDPPRLGLYVCGVTVYDLCHLGHARSYAVWDTLVRHLRARSYSVTYVRNITDVDDKIIRRAAELGVPMAEVVAKNIADMHRDFGALGIRRPDIEPLATEHIGDMVAHIAHLIERGAAYESAGDVYFAVDRFPTYGALSGQPLEELQAGARVEPGEKKRSPLDFALWKAAKPGEPSWDSPWGRGRPGWHIECSAMSARYLGGSFDLHTGGKDLVFPHHQNELAQSQALTGPGTFSKYWMHNGFVTLNDEKMSKSTGNFFTIRQCTGVHDAEALRLYLMSVHYRSPINVDVEERAGRPWFPAVAEAERRLEYFYTTLERLGEAVPAATPAAEAGPLALDLAALERAFGEALDDDLNTAVAMATLGEVAAAANKLLDESKSVAKDVRRRTLIALRDALARMGGELGVLEQPPADWLRARRARLAAARGVVEGDIDALLAERDAARRGRDFARADGIRAQLGTRGIEVMDTPAGTRWRFAP